MSNGVFPHILRTSCALALAATLCSASIGAPLAYAAESSRIGATSSPQDPAATESSETQQSDTFSPSDTEIAQSTTAPTQSSRVGAGELNRDSFIYIAPDSTQDTSQITHYPPYWTSANGMSSYTYNNITVEAPGVQSLGIDVSEHQGVIDWQQVKNAGIGFAIIRCGFGGTESREDYMWVQNALGAKEAGIPFGVYLYSYADTAALADLEASQVLAALKKVGISPTDLALPIYYDLEEDSLGTPANKELLGSMATAFCSKVQSAGFEAGIYANVNWWLSYLTDPAFGNLSWHRWVAGYFNGQNSVNGLVSSAEMWQFCSRGTVAGISGFVDMNFRYIDIPVPHVAANEESPLISDLQVVEQCEDGFLVQCTIADTAAISSVKVSSWRTDLTASSAQWYKAIPADGVITCYIPISRQGGLAGSYSTQVYAYDFSGGVTVLSVDFTIDSIRLKNSTGATQGKRPQQLGIAL